MMIKKFFFSSRRRHTRWTGDWSSDVCSSDLALTATAANAAPVGLVGQTVTAHATIVKPLTLTKMSDMDFRSEERRVGKECKVQMRQYEKLKYTTKLLKLIKIFILIIEIVN